MKANLSHASPSPCRFLGLLLLWLPLWSLPARSDQEGDFTFVIQGTDAVLAGYTGRGGAVVIPDRLGGRPVISIGPFAFASRDRLTSVTLPNSVTAIGQSAFDRCTNLASVALPNSVTAIGQSAFNRCTSLASVALPDTVTAIGDYTFSGCTSLTTVILPTSVTAIGGEAFFGCTSLASVAFPTSVVSIGHSAFSSCTNLASVTLPNSVTYIDTGAFAFCTSLASVTIPNSVTAIGWDAFSDCTSLTVIAVDELNLAYSSVGGVLFDKTQSMLIAYPGGKAGPYAIPNSVTKITSFAFCGCTRLTSVTVPNSVSEIGIAAFSGCTSLASIYFEGNAPAAGGSAFSSLFGRSPFVIVFRRPGATGWGDSYEERPTAVWVPLSPYADWAASTGLAAQFPTLGAEADDPDGDGFTNADEWHAGTDPTQATSHLELEQVPRPADLTKEDRTPVPRGRHVVHFRSVPGRYYGVQRARTLGGAWELQGTRIASTTQTRFVLEIPDETQVFYRVEMLP